MILPSEPARLKDNWALDGFSPPILDGGGGAPPTNLVIFGDGGGGLMTPPHSILNL